MIKFFRHIRQRLLVENRFSKYLLYAIGEIALVMIGILLALQVNNWNEKRKQQHQEAELYEVLFESLKADSADVRRVRGLFDKGMNALEFIVSRSFEELKEDYSLQALRDSLARTSFIGYSFFPRYGAYNQITNNGYLALIQSEEIKSKLAELYDRTYPRYEHIDASMDEKSEFHLEPILRGDLQIMESTDGIQNYEDFNSERFESYYRKFNRECLSILSTSVYAERSLIECDKRIHELLMLIRKELSHSNP
jgi:hypothetical protein